MQNSPFLRKHVDKADESAIAVFHRREIQTGSQIGTGGFSEVYEITGFDLDPAVTATCTVAQQLLREECAAVGCERRFALKHLKRRLVHSPKDFQRAACDLATEAAYMSALDHPNILAVRGLPVDGLAAFADGDHDGYFLITDRLTGTLGDRIQEWKKTNIDKVPSIKEKAEYALQVASALNYLHANRIVFRDLKPHNMGFAADASGTIQLFDFGLCRELPAAVDGSNDVYEMSGVGTRRYMAPEIINGSCYNAKVDVYSWAMVTWELLTGCKPYASYGVEEHRIAVCQGGERPRLPPRFAGWPDWLLTVLRQSWVESICDRLPMDHIVLKLTAGLRDDDNVVDDVPKRPMSLLDSPVAVHEFADTYDLSTELCYFPELSAPTGTFLQRRHQSLNLQHTLRHDDDDTSCLFPAVMDSSLLGLTLNLEEGVEVCANGNNTFSLTLTPTSQVNRLLPRRRIVASCTL